MSGNLLVLNIALTGDLVLMVLYGQAEACGEVVIQILAVLLFFLFNILVYDGAVEYEESKDSNK